RRRSFPDGAWDRADIRAAVAPANHLHAKRLPSEKNDAGLPCIRRLVHDSPSSSARTLGQTRSTPCISSADLSNILRFPRVFVGFPGGVPEFPESSRSRRREELVSRSLRRARAGTPSGLRLGERMRPSPWRQNI